MAKKTVVRMIKEGRIVAEDTYLNREYGEVVNAVPLEGEFKRDKDNKLVPATTGKTPSYHGNDSWEGHHYNDSGIKSNVSYYPTGTTRTFKSCTHDGGELIFEMDGKKVYGAKKDDIYPYDANLIIDCIGLFFTAPDKFVKDTPTPDRFKVLNELIVIPVLPEILRLDWRDYQPPGATAARPGLAFWTKLWELMPEGKTIICCQGGHGRTGTCAASLMIANGIGAAEAIAIVKKQYCSSAIESVNQHDYLRDLEEGLYDYEEAETETDKEGK